MSDPIPPSPAPHDATLPPRSPEPSIERTIDHTPGRPPDPAGGGGPAPATIGRYHIRKILGAGAMGTVYLAHDPHLDRPVALKVPQFEGGANPILVERFLREARAAATLAHPNICPVYDSGQADGVPFLAMAYVEGKPLDRFIDGSPRLPERGVAAIVRQLALAMQHAHEAGVVHRDLKPANVMLNTKKQPVVMDFGLAYRAGGAADETRLTRSGTIMGTPAYMSPEQVNGDPTAVGPASDQYSLGVILYELLTGRTPFQGPFGALLGQIALDPPPPPEKFRPGLDRGLQAICLKTLAKLPADRYPSMAAFATALGDWLKGGGPVAIPAAVGRAEPSPATVFAELAAQPAPPPEPAPTPRRAVPVLALWSGGGVVCAGLLAGVLWLVLGRGDSRPSADASSRVHPVPSPQSTKRNDGSGPTDRGKKAAGGAGEHTEQPNRPDDGTPPPGGDSVAGHGDSKTTGTATPTDGGEKPPPVPTPPAPPPPETKPTPPADKPVAAPESPPPARLPVPDKDATARARDVVRASYKADLDRRDHVAWAELATRLIRASNAEVGNPALRYALLLTAEDVAAQGYALRESLAAADERARVFEAEPAAARVDALTAVAHALERPEVKKLPPGVLLRLFLDLGDAASAVADEAVDGEEYDRAAAAYRLAAGAAQRVKAPSLLARARDDAAEAEALAREFQKVREARAVLAGTPGDPAASFTVGRYLCLRRDRWDEGLTLLAAGAEPAWQTAARADRSAVSPQDQAAAGDHWWALAEGQKGAQRAAVLRRAARWYERAAADLTRVDQQPRRAAVVKRLRAIDAPPDLARFPAVTDQVWDRTHTTAPAGRGTDGAAEQGFANGRHFISAKPGVNWWFDHWTHPADFAIRVVGRVVEPRPDPTAAAGVDGWGVSAAAGPNTWVTVRVDGTGAIHVEPSPDLVAGAAKPDPVRPKAAKPFNRFNEVLVVCRGRVVDLFVNGERVRPPLTLARPLGAGGVTLGAVAGPDLPERVEFGRLVISSLAPGGS